MLPSVANPSLAQRVHMIQQRQRTRKDPSFGMHITRTFPGNGLITGTVGSLSLREDVPITVSCKFRLKDNSATEAVGTLWAMGDMSLTIAGGQLAPTVDGNTVDALTIPGLSDLNVTDDYHLWKVIMAVNPGADLVHLYVNGYDALSQEGVMAGSGQWSDTGSALSTGPLLSTGVRHVEDVKLFECQQPLQFI